ncbi:hypothetical protein GHU05_06985 [Fructobacillus tropaeoli]|uniref:hypothetical protein n=1 Tax=Fructobacillus tropaeoli TaxID=709323 RepID=UPI001456257E|nr:hypothetical protein [Fructobacillus tropaeoli]NLS38665.1 hypothetical protein [Fructobacillus tropaeoli]
MNEETYIEIIKLQADVISSQSELISTLSDLVKSLTDETTKEVVVSGFSKTEG